MRCVCIQVQPDRAPADAPRVRQAFREMHPDTEVVAAEDGGNYENIMFHVESPEEALTKVLSVLNSPDVGRAARSSCIIVCEGKRGWSDYLLLHHYDRTLHPGVAGRPPAE